MVKKIIAMLKMTPYLGAMAVLSVSSLTYAEFSTDFLNNTTGFNSENKNDIFNDKNFDVNVENDSFLDNPFDFFAETGENDISRNTSVEDQITGNVEVAADFSNELNEDSLGFDWGLGSGWNLLGDFSGGNRITGPYSENINVTENDYCLDIDLENRARINNEFDLEARTGENRVSRNTLVGDIETGSVDISINAENSVNGSAGNFDLGFLNEGGLSSDFLNSTTGPNSRNINRVESDARVDINIDNNAVINNEFDVEANTGENDISQNTVVGDIRTGDVSVDISAVNSAN